MRLMVEQGNEKMNLLSETMAVATIETRRMAILAIMTFVYGLPDALAVGNTCQVH